MQIWGGGGEKNQFGSYLHIVATFLLNKPLIIPSLQRNSARLQISESSSECILFILIQNPMGRRGNICLAPSSHLYLFSSILNWKHLNHYE